MLQSVQQLEQRDATAADSISTSWKTVYKILRGWEDMLIMCILLFSHAMQCDLSDSERAPNFVQIPEECDGDPGND
jgi:hypothetical protein